jgi:hypothetical protein
MRRASIWLLPVVSLLAFVQHASAQSSAGQPLSPVSAAQVDPSPATPPGEPAPTLPPPAAEPAPPPPAPPAPPPPPPAPSTPGTLDALANLIRFHGIIRPVVTFSGGALESFSNPNASAPTAAANPILANLADESRLTLQVAQTRFGFWINEPGELRGHLEFDFIDFGKSSPTVQALLRLRIATVEWSPTKSFTIAAGQDWDLPNPINPFGLNLVGGNFQAGNTGFMRQQIKATYKPADALELGFAVGLQAPNATPKDAAVELARVPTFALRVTALLGSAGRIGMGGIISQLRLSPGPMQRRAWAGSGNIFGEVTPTPTTTLRFEGYVGSNAANLGLLSIGQGRLQEDVAEAGGFISVRQGVLSNQALYATYGTAHTLDPDEVVPSYSYPDMDMQTLSTAVSAGSGPGIRWNQVARIGYEWKPLKPLAIALEGFWYNTSHALLPVDGTRVKTSKPSVLGIDVGMAYSF